MTRAAALHGVPLNVLYSVGLTETGRRGELSPYDMNVDGQAVHSTSLAEAMARFAQAKERGAKFIDIGCMQINHRFHGADFRSLSEMFDPARNVEYAANFLKSLKAQEGSWTLAVARYNAGPGNPAAERTYVCSVIRNMVASGFGRMDGQRARALPVAGPSRWRVRIEPLQLSWSTIREDHSAIGDRTSAPGRRDGASAPIRATAVARWRPGRRLIWWMNVQTRQVVD